MGLHLEDSFADGTLVRPTHREAGIVHLIQAIAQLTGVGGIDPSPPMRELMDLIGRPDHLIFVLRDGLGMSTVRRLPGDSFFASHVRRELIATCPSTTACALTTVATASFPNRHGISGWFTFFPELMTTATVLPFKERFTGQPLVERGIRPQDVLRLPPILPRMAHRALTVTPSNIANTTYNHFCRGGTAGVGYDTIPRAVDRIIEEVRAAKGPTYTHLYLPEIDTICHHLGVDHPDVLPKVMQIDREIGWLAAAVAGRATLVLSADHGLIDVPRDDQMFLFPSDPLLDLLLVPPTGDARMPVFHVHPRGRDSFAEQFVTRFGDFIAFPHRPATLAYHGADKSVGNVFLAVHAGLSPQEMWVPLCVA